MTTEDVVTKLYEAARNLGMATIAFEKGDNEAGLRHLAIMDAYINPVRFTIDRTVNILHKLKDKMGEENDMVYTGGDLPGVVPLVSTR